MRYRDDVTYLDASAASVPFGEHHPLSGQVEGGKHGGAERGDDFEQIVPGEVGEEEEREEEFSGAVEEIEGGTGGVEDARCPCSLAQRWFCCWLFGLWYGR